MDLQVRNIVRNGKEAPSLKIYNGDCLEVMDKLISEGVKVDAIITDPPYGTTACKWDSIIPFDKMWERLNKLIKHNGAIVLFGSEPFSSGLRMSNIKNYKYDWVWKKHHTNQLNARKQPLRENECISIFYNKQPIYNPQFTNGTAYEVHRTNYKGSETLGKQRDHSTISDGKRYPKSILEFKEKMRYHPTQKPVALMEYLVKTYTNENETVLDFTMGSGTTGVACKNTNRNFIGIELDENYFKIAKERIEKAHETKELYDKYR